jgi:hypothetical protein
MKPSRRRRLILWSLGMGMVAAFIQSRLAAARMAQTCPPPQDDRDSPRQVQAVDPGNPGVPLSLSGWASTDHPNVSRSFSLWGASIECAPDPSSLAPEEPPNERLQGQPLDEDGEDDDGVGDGE